MLEGEHRGEQQSSGGTSKDGGPHPDPTTGRGAGQLVGDPGSTQGLGSGGGATTSVEDNTNEGKVHWNTLANLSASSRSVQFPEVASQALDGAHGGRVEGSTGRVGILALRQAEKDGVHLGTTTSKPTSHMPHPSNITIFFPTPNLGGPHRRAEEVRISRRQGRDGMTARSRFLTGHHRRPGAR